VCVAFGIQHALCMRYIILPSVACLTCNIFSRYLTNGTILKNATEHNMHVLMFSTTLSSMLLILIRIERDMTKMCTGFHVNYPLFLSEINET
jgi:hypothetical protein